MGDVNSSYDSSGILATARAWRDTGQAVIPIGANKEPACGQVIPHRTRWIDDAKLEGFMGHAPGLAVLTGTSFRSDGLKLLVLDFDDARTVDLIVDTADAAGIAVVARAFGGYVVRTPSGGTHLYILTPQPGKNQKLASRPAPTDDNPKGVKALVETRGIGGYAVTAPSHGKVHPSGEPYRVVRGAPSTMAVFSVDETEEILDFIRKFDEMPRRSAQPSKRVAAVDGDRPGDRYNQKLGPVGLIKLLTVEGWTVVREVSDRTYLRRPGKDAGISGTVFHSGTPQFWSFTTSTSFDSERSYDAFGVYAVVEHDGDWARAAKQLYADGYGKRPYVNLRVTKRLGQESSASGDATEDEPLQDDEIPVTALSDTLLAGGGRFWRKEGFAPEKLTNGVVWIDAYVQESIGPGVTATRFRMRGKLVDGTELPPVDIETDDLGDVHRWPSRSGPLWSRFILEPGLAVRDQVRACIQLYSEMQGVPAVQRHSETGWCEANGRVFRSHGCAIGAVGVRTDVEVHLDEGLQKYTLPAPPPAADLPRLGRQSLRVLDIAPDSVSVPLLIAPVRAILSDTIQSDHALYLGGPTGSYKSSLQGVSCSFFGPGFASGRSAPLNFESTANSLEANLWRLKNVLAWIDDAAPESARGHGESLFARLDRLARATGNGTGKGRLTADARLRPTYTPRGTFLASGEDNPRGHSATARLGVIPVSRNAVDLSALSECQRYGQAGDFAALTASVIKHLAGKWDTLEGVVARIFDEEVMHAHQVEWGHPRTASFVAGYVTAGRVLADFLQAAGSISEIERAALVQRIRKGMFAAGQQQRVALRDVDPVTVFTEGVRSAIDGGVAHLLDRSSNAEPHQASRFGWLTSTVSFGDHPEQVSRARGKPIGWVDLDEGQIHLDPTNAHRAVNDVHGRDGVAIAHGVQALGQRLLDAGKVLNADPGRSTTRVYVGNGKQRDRKRCWSFRLETFFPDDEAREPLLFHHDAEVA